MNQAEGHATDLQPIAFLKMNRQKPLVVIDAEHFLDIFFGDKNVNRRTN